MEILCSCGKRLRVKDELLGKRVKCPACGEGILIRDAEENVEKKSSRHPSKEEQGSPIPRRRKKSASATQGASPTIWILVGAAALVVIVTLSVGLFLYLNRNKGGGPAESNPQQAKDLPSDNKTAGRNPLMSEPYVDLVTFSPDGKKLAMASRAVNAGGTVHTVKQWDLPTGTEEKRFEGHRDFISGLDYSPDGTLLASGSAQGSELKLWSVGTGKLLHEVKPADSKEKALRLVGFSADGKLVVARNQHGITAMSVQDGSLRRFDIMLNSLYTTMVCSPVANAVLFTDVDPSANPPQPRLALFDLDKWNISNFDKLDDLSSDIAFSRDGKTLARASSAGPIVLLDGTSWKQRAKLERKRGEPGFQYFEKIALSRDGGLVLAKPLGQRRPNPEVWETSKSDARAIDDGYCTSLALSPDGRTIALVKGEGVRFYDSVTLKEKNP